MRAKCDLQTKEFRYCDMKKVLSVLMVLVLTTMCALAKDESKSTVQRIRVNHKGITPASSWEKLELGVQVGVGFHLGTNSPTDGYTRVFQNALTQQVSSGMLFNISVRNVSSIIFYLCFFFFLP